MNVTHQIANYIQTAEYDGFPEVVIEKAKLCLLDWIGVTLAGAREPISDVMFDLASVVGGGEQATIVGRGTKTNVLLASLINGTNAHALDFDDVHIESPGHPSAPIIPATLSLAESRHFSGRNFITSFIVGVQVFFSVGAANLPFHYDEGWHNTGTVGHVAAAAASAKLLGLTDSHLVNALGIGTTQAAGIKNVFGTMCKPFHAGKAAMDGLLAALLAEKGFTSSEDAIGGHGGFLDVYSSKSHPEALEKALNDSFCIEDVRFKRYPSCFATHPAIDCMLSLRNQYEINSENIAEILCIAYPRCLEIAAIPEPGTGLEGKFSVQYCLALALHEGKLLLESFNDAKVKEPSLTSVMKKVKFASEQSYQQTRTSEVIIKFRDGKSIQEKVSLSELLSDPEREKADVTQKFRDITYALMPKKSADRILESVNSLEEIDNMADLVALCRF